MELQVYLHPDRDTVEFQREALRLLRLIAKQGAIEMATLDEVLAEVAEEATKVDSIIALTEGLRQQLADALSGVTLPPEAQAKIDQIFESAKASADKINTAITVNTDAPVAPAPVDVEQPQPDPDKP